MFPGCLSWDMWKTCCGALHHIFLHVAVSAFTDYIKSLSPSTLDMELRMLQIIDDDDQQEPEKRPELFSIELLLDYLIHETSCRNNFEFVQAVIRLFLKVLFSLSWSYVFLCLIILQLVVAVVVLQAFQSLTE